MKKNTLKESLPTYNSELIFENRISGGSSLLTVADLATFFNIPIKTVYKWVSERKIPYIKIGKLLRFDRAKIQAWLSERSNHGN